jgi:hypothetical protein
MLLSGAEWRFHRHFAPFSERSRPGWRSRPEIRTDVRIIPPFSAGSSAEINTPALGGVKCRKDRCLGSLSGPWGPQAGFPGRLGLLDFLAAGEFQEVGIDFVGQPGVGIACLVAWMGWSALALP